jgi:L-rhamnose mutarotase
MQQIAFKMKLRPGFEAEYKKRHDEIWPELVNALKEAGILSYAIFLDDETGTLFAIQQVEAGHTTADLPNLPIMQQWWHYMKDLMDTHPDHSPITMPLTEVFFLA